MKNKISDYNIGFIGLGRMGANMVSRLLKSGIQVAVYNRTPEKTRELETKGAIGTYSYQEFINKLGNKRIIWIMVSHQAVDDMLREITPLLHKDDIIVDGGNSNFNESIRRAKEAENHGIHYLDVGVSGGIIAAKVGYCMMIGGNRTAYEIVKPFIHSMCIDNGYGFMGQSGSGHYVKMIHNAIEYGMMEAIGEGYHLLSKGHFKDLDLLEISKVWSNGSIIRGFLIDMTKNSFEHHPNLKDVPGFVADNGEGRWAVEEAMKHNVPFTVNSQALFSRYRSRETETMANKIVAAIRDEFGGHGVGKESAKK